MLQLPEWSGGSLPVKTEPLQIVLLLLLVVVVGCRWCVGALVGSLVRSLVGSFVNEM